MTPPDLADRVVKHFLRVEAGPLDPYDCGESQRRAGTLALDPCRGEGAFYDALLPHFDCVEWCERRAGMDFFEYSGPRVHWIISNPPYSILLPFLEQAFRYSDNVVFLVATTAPFFTSRLDAAQRAGFGIRELLRIDFPKEWSAQGVKKFGMGLAAVHWMRGWRDGMITVDGRTTQPKETTASTRSYLEKED